jgi:iron complex outermembrane receptor protein
MNTRCGCAALALAVAIAAAAVEVRAQGPPPKAGVDLALLSIEDLMNIEITSASHKEQRFGDTSAAVYVITSEDIRRSGLTSLPELFRLVPGMQVAQINSNKWAVAVRGFNSLFSDKLLVLIDGRTMYDRLNSGVFWESLDIPLDLIDRIEVIRGSGGATWGANAMNGVINVVTKSAADTAGAAVTVRTGSFDGTQAALRYGGRAGPVAYRASSQWSGTGESFLDAKTGANDTWTSQTHGVRLDWTRAANTFMAQAGATLASVRGLWPAPSGPVPEVKGPFDESTDTREYYGIGRWSRRRDDGSSLEVQTFLNYRHNVDAVNPRQLLADVDARYHTVIGVHDVVTGGGYRFLNEKTDGAFAFSIAPRDVQEKIVNAFVQDEIALTRRIRVTLGAKVERDPYSGWGVQPTARAMWAVVPKRHHVWGAVSKAFRTPSLGDVSGRYNPASFVGQGGLPVVVGLLGNPDFQNERVVNGEAGYRLELGGIASVDVTAFVASYDGLRTAEPQEPRIELTPAPAHLLLASEFQNLLEATTRGMEVAARWTAAPWWRLEAGYSAFHLTPHLSPQSRDEAAASFSGTAPGSQWRARSSMSLNSRVQLDAMLFRTGAIASIGVPAYTRADLRGEVTLTSHLTASVVGQNLLDPRHAEYGGRGLVTATQIPRSAKLQLRWVF